MTKTLYAAATMCLMVTCTPADSSSDASVDAVATDVGANDATVDAVSEPDVVVLDSSADVAADVTSSSCNVDASVCGTGVVVGPEITIPPPSPGNRQVFPAVAGDGTNFLLVWEEGLIANDGTIMASRVCPGGTLLDTPFAVSALGSETPSVGFDGTNYVVAWNVPNGGGNNPIYIARVSTAGVLLDTNGIAIPGSGNAPRVGCGVGSCLVAWMTSKADAIQAIRIDSSGTLLDKNPITVVASPNADAGVIGETAFPRVDFDGTDYLVTWLQEPGSTTSKTTSFRWTKISGSTGMVLALGNAINPTSMNGFPSAPAVAFDGTNHFILWTPFPTSNTDPPDIYGSRVTAANAVLDTNGIFVGSKTTTFDAVDFDGKHFIAVYGQPNDAGSGLLGSRVSDDGGVESPFSIQQTTVSTEPYFPEVAASGSGTSLAAYHLCGSGGVACVLHARILTNCGN
jgi:hypothetical protein